MTALILGGGISALSAARFLQKEGRVKRIVLLEKGKGLGGWMVRGPKTFQAKRSPHLLALVRELGLRVVFREETGRYLWVGGKLRSVKSFWWAMARGAWRDWWGEAGEGEESIDAFARRRFGGEVAEVLFDSLTAGIYGGDPKRLSLKCCFPKLYEWERGAGSVVRGMLREKRGGVGGLFSVEGGMEKVVERLTQELSIEIHLETPVEEVFDGGVIAGGRRWEGDEVYSALPGGVIGKLTGLWPHFEATSLWSVTMNYPREVLRYRGFGYLVPTRERREVPHLLGMVWNSASSLTAMLSEGGDPVEEALRGARLHLGIEEPPREIDPWFAADAIPSFTIGYEERKALFQREVQQRFPRLKLLGNYLKSPSVEECIAWAHSQIIGQSPMGKVRSPLV